MTATTAVRPKPSTVQQWWVLTVRLITPTLRNGEVLTQVAQSVMFTIGFYIPLKHILGAFTQGMSSYAQYLMPLIVLKRSRSPPCRRRSGQRPIRCRALTGDSKPCRSPR